MPSGQSLRHQQDELPTYDAHRPSEPPVIPAGGIGPLDVTGRLLPASAGWQRVVSSTDPMDDPQQWAAYARLGTTGALAVIAAAAGRRGPGMPGSEQRIPGEYAGPAAGFATGHPLDVAPGGLALMGFADDAAAAPAPSPTISRTSVRPNARGRWSARP